VATGFVVESAVAVGERAQGVAGGVLDTEHHRHAVLVAGEFADPVAQPRVARAVDGDRGRAQQCPELVECDSDVGVLVGVDSDDDARAGGRQASRCSARSASAGSKRCGSNRPPARSRRSSWSGWVGSASGTWNSLVCPDAADVLRWAGSLPCDTTRVAHPRLGGEDLVHGDPAGPAVAEVVEVAEPIALHRQANSLTLVSSMTCRLGESGSGIPWRRPAISNSCRCQVDLTRHLHMAADRRRHLSQHDLQLEDLRLRSHARSGHAQMLQAHRRRDRAHHF